GTERSPSRWTPTRAALARSKPGSSWSRTGWTLPSTSSAPSASGARPSTVTSSRKGSTTTWRRRPRRRLPHRLLPSPSPSRIFEMRVFFSVKHKHINRAYASLNRST
ncbi:unnamed protein product, partial [Hapterophycus canaliculatus]